MFARGDTAFSKFPNSYFYLVYSRETDTAEATIDDHCSFDEVGQEGGAGQGDVSGCKNNNKHLSKKTRGRLAE
jgi:hypothetical protein